MRFLIIFIFLISNSFANEAIDIKNLVINKKLIKRDGLTILNYKNKRINLDDYKGKLILLNFWATWCAPCKEEMPSLDTLQTHKSLDNLKIQNLNTYFDSPITLAKKFGLRGIPTSILFNKKGEEFARVIGSINFTDEKFIEWLSNYN